MNNDDLLKKAKDYRWYAQKASNSHYDMAERAKIRHKRLGIPVTVLTAIVGTAIFATLSSQTHNLRIQIATGLLSLTATVLAALQTFLNYSDQSAQHKSAAVKFEAIQHRLDIFILKLAAGDLQRDAALKEFEEIGQTLHDISAQAPTVPDSIYDAAHPIRAKAPPPKQIE